MTELEYVVSEEVDASMDSDEEFEQVVVVQNTPYVEEPVTVTIENAMTIGEDEIKVESVTNHDHKDQPAQKDTRMMRNVTSKRKRQLNYLERQDLVMIKAIRARPALWHSRYFRDHKLKQTLFEEVAAICKMPVDTVKRRWRDKRDSFVKWQRKIETSSERPKVMWRWYNLMQFVAPVSRHKDINLEDCEALESIKSPDEDTTQSLHCDPLLSLDFSQKSPDHLEVKCEPVSMNTGSPTVQPITERLPSTNEDPEVSIVKIVNRQRPILPKPVQQIIPNRPTPAKLAKTIMVGLPNQYHHTDGVPSNPSEKAMGANGNKLATTPCQAAVTPQMVDPLAEPPPRTDEPPFTSNLTESDLVGRLVAYRLKELPTPTRQRLICKITNLLYSDCV